MSPCNVAAPVCLRMVVLTVAMTYCWWWAGMSHLVTTWSTRSLMWAGTSTSISPAISTSTLGTCSAHRRDTNPAYASKLELTKIMKFMVESSHLDRIWPISHIVTSPGLTEASLSHCVSGSGSGSGQCLSTTASESLACVPGASGPPTHIVFKLRKPRVSQITVWCQQVLAFYKISSKFVDAGLNFKLSHHPPTSPLVLANGPHKNRGNIGVEIIISIYFVCDHQIQKCVALSINFMSLWKLEP